MDVKTGSSFQFNKESDLKSARMQRFPDLASAQLVLTNDGMFGYVQNVGVYLNINGTVTQIAPSTVTGGSNAKAFYQASAPTGLGGTDVGTLWYNTSNSSLNIWGGSGFIQIGGTGNSSIVIPAWVANATYVDRQVVEYNDDLWINITGNSIATTTFNTAEWKNLTENKVKNYDLLRSQSNGTTNGDIDKSGDGLTFTVNHNCNNQYLKYVATDAATNEEVLIKVIYTSVNSLDVVLPMTLTDIGIDLKLRIWC